MFNTLLSGHWRGSGRLPAWPSQCHVCRAWPAQPVCDDCVGRFGQPVHRCLTCALQVPQAVRQCGACLKQPPPLDLCLAAVDYGFPWSTLIPAFKFHAQTGMARSMATLLRAAPWVEDALASAQLLLPMPLSAQRLRERGYNQALLLAQQLAADKCRADVLLKLVDTPAQHTLTRSQRLVALDGALAVDPLRAKLLIDRHVILVDDVMTTGASLSAAARVLKDAGAARVTAVVFARTA